MLKKARAEMKDAAAEAGESAQGVLDSSRQIWLAGLGAFSRAQKEGAKLFDTLVAQGERLESRTRKAAVDTASAAKEAAASKAKEMQAMAGGTWDKLEQVFEDRVARALSKLGVYTQSDVERLAQKVDALSDAVNELIKGSGKAPAARKPRAAKKAPAKAPPARRGRKPGPKPAKAAKPAAKKAPRRRKAAAPAPAAEPQA
jgi:poly(hydroxyalkanoate) granule-associated protein